MSKYPLHIPASARIAISGSVTLLALPLLSDDCRKPKFYTLGIAYRSPKDEPDVFQGLSIAMHRAMLADFPIPAAMVKDRQAFEMMARAFDVAFEKQAYKGPFISLIPG